MTDDSTVLLSTQGIRRLSRFGPPFLMVDRVELGTDKDVIRGIKNVSVNEAFFCGHFPGNPIMPGVLQVGAMAQLVEIGCRYWGGDDSMEYFLRSIRRVRFRRPVVPGDTLQIEAEISTDGGHTSAIARCRVGEQVTCEAQLEFEAVVDPATFFSPRSLTVPPRIDLESNDSGSSAWIMSVIPHRFPFLLIDRILSPIDSKDACESLVGLKVVTGNEPLFQAQTGAFPFLPNISQIEIAAQIGCVCMLIQEQFAGMLAYFMSIDKAVFHEPVLPGDTLIVEVSVSMSRQRYGKAVATIHVGDTLVTETNLKFVLVNPDKENGDK